MTFSKVSSITILTLLNRFETASTNAAFYLYSNKELSKAEARKASELKAQLTEYIIYINDELSTKDTDSKYNQITTNNKPA